MLNTEEFFCDYFQKGANKNQRIGLELEHFVLKSDNSVLSYKDGVGDVLKNIAPKFDKTAYESGNILGLANEKYAISLEPGAKMEVSVSPMTEIGEIEEAFDEFYAAVNPELEKHNAHLAAKPVLTYTEPENIEMIPKKRYEYMDRYFRTTGSMGSSMMRASASAQVSIDYENEADFARKFRAAYILTPFFALASAGRKTYDGYLKRISIWNDVDKARTAPPADLFDDGFGFKSYARGLLSVPAIFVPLKEEYIYTADEPISSLCSRYPLTTDMAEHYLSMVFPDVRLKNYIEIRAADSMPKNCTAAYGALAKIIFYTGEILEYIEKRYAGVKISDIENAKLSAVASGCDALFYGHNAHDELLRLYDIASKYGNYSDFSAFAERTEK